MFSLNCLCHSGCMKLFICRRIMILSFWEFCFHTCNTEGRTQHNCLIIGHRLNRLWYVPTYHGLQSGHWKSGCRRRFSTVSKKADSRTRHRMLSFLWKQGAMDGVFVYPCPSSYVEILTAKVMMLGGGALGGDSIRRVEPFWMGLVPLWKRTQRAPRLFYHVRAQWEDSHLLGGGP